MGAENEEDSGLFFSWGNTDGHAEGSGYDFSEAKYNDSPAAAINTNLSLSQDAARSNLGAPWRMPTADEFQELYDNCIWVWTTKNGVAGQLFTSKVNGSTLFFPADGNYVGTNLGDRGTNGYYWAATYYSATNARSLRFSSSDIRPQGNSGRRFGFSVRAVLNL